MQLLQHFDVERRVNVLKVSIDMLASEAGSAVVI